MALKAILTMEEHSALSAGLQSEYRLTDDGQGYMLDVIGSNGFALENVSGLKSALEKERQEGRTAATKLKAFENLDPAKAREALKKVESMANFNPEEQVAAGIKEREAQLIARHQEAMTLSTQKSDGYKTQLERMLVENASMKALQDAGGNPLLLTPHLRSQIRMRETDNGMIAEVYNPSTGAARVGDAQGNPMTIPQLVAELKANDQFSMAFNGTGSTGSGSTNGATGSAKRPAGQQTAKATVVSLADQDALDDNWEGFLDGSVRTQEGSA